MQAQMTTQKEVKFVSFTIGDSLYGLDIRLVKEVNTNTNITYVPLSKPHIRGLVNIRGQIVLVIDSSVLFCGKEHVLSPNSHLVILKTIQDFEQVEAGSGIDIKTLPDKPIALLVDSIGNVLSTPANMLEKPPQHMNKDRSKFVQSVLKTDAFFLIVLNHELLIAGDHASIANQNSQTV